MKEKTTISPKGTLGIPLLFAVAVISSGNADTAWARRGGSGYHIAPLTTVSPKGAAKQVEVLLDTPHVKLSRVVLRRGTTLSEHAAEGAATVQVLAGSGILTLPSAKSEKLVASQIVFLAPNLPHGVIPSGKRPLVLLIHRLKQSTGPLGRPGAGRGRK